MWYAHSLIRRAGTLTASPGTVYPLVPTHFYHCPLPFTNVSVHCKWWRGDSQCMHSQFTIDKIDNADSIDTSNYDDCAITNDLDRPSRTCKLFLSENNCSPLLQSLIERPGNVMKDNNANELEWLQRLISGTINGFFLFKKIQHI